MKTKTWVIVLNYLVIYLVWGSTYFAIKLAIQSMPSFFVVGFRFFFGGLLLLIFAAIRQRFTRWPTRREFLRSIFLAILLLAGGNGLVTLAEHKVDSYVAALIIATTPIFVALFNRFLLGIHISWIGLVGILAGIIGVGFILYDGHSMLASFTPHTLLVLAAVACWGLATSLGKKIKGYPDTLINSGIQMIFVGGVSLLAVFIFQPRIIELMGTFTVSSIWGLAYLTVFGSLGFAAYIFLLQNEPAIRVVSYALVNPLIAVLLGLLIGSEKQVPLLFWGLPFILFGIFLMLYGEAFLKKIWRQNC